MLCSVSSPFLSKYCNNDCNWVGVPNSTSFKLWGIPNNNIKKWGTNLNSFRLRERRLHDILVTTFNLDWHLETFAAAELCLFDRQLIIVFDIGNGRWRIIFQQVLMVQAQEMDIHIYPLVILLKYSTSGYHSWSQILSLLFLKTDVVAQLLMLSIVELLKSYTVLKFLKLEIVVKILKLSRVAEFLISVRSKVLFIKALLAIVYCIAQ